MKETIIMPNNQNKMPVKNCNIVKNDNFLAIWENVVNGTEDLDAITGGMASLNPFINDTFGEIIGDELNPAADDYNEKFFGRIFTGTQSFAEKYQNHELKDNPDFMNCAVYAEMLKLDNVVSAAPYKEGEAVTTGEITAVRPNIIDPEDEMDRGFWGNLWHSIKKFFSRKPEKERNFDELFEKTVADKNRRQFSRKIADKLFYIDSARIQNNSGIQPLNNDEPEAVLDTSDNFLEETDLDFDEPQVTAENPNPVFEDSDDLSDEPEFDVDEPKTVFTGQKTEALDLQSEISEDNVTKQSDELASLLENLKKQTINAEKKQKQNENNGTEITVSELGDKTEPKTKQQQFMENQKPTASLSALLGETDKENKKTGGMTN